jgi:hypothetical protein
MNDYKLIKTPIKFSDITLSNPRCAGCVFYDYKRDRALLSNCEISRRPATTDERFPDLAACNDVETATMYRIQLVHVLTEQVVDPEEIVELYNETRIQNSPGE